MEPNDPHADALHQAGLNRAGPEHVHHVLLVEDSKSIRNLLATFIANLEGVSVVTAGTFAQAEACLREGAERFFCAVLDLNLPDAANGEVVDLVRQFDIPVVVLTGSVDHELREAMLKKQVIDYIVKRNATEIEYVASVVNRLHENHQVKVLVVDDSPSFRAYLDALLKNYRYSTYLASHGREALQVLEQHPDISLIMTDFHMPQMNGQQLIENVRRHYRREDLAIIGLSDTSQRGLSAMLLKSGANDFLPKPFEVEEFYCRVTHNVNMISYVRQIRDSATRDFLTKAYNRRYLFDVGETFYANAKRGSIRIAAALIDADHFKNINDTFGHQVGDQALKQIAVTLHKAMRRSDIVARYGGEEFVCLAVVKSAEDAPYVFERVRAALERIDLQVDGQRVPISASIGVTLALENDLEAMINRADQAVYQAKKAGRNRVVFL